MAVRIDPAWLGPRWYAPAWYRRLEAYADILRAVQGRVRSAMPAALAPAYDNFGRRVAGDIWEGQVPGLVQPPYALIQEHGRTEYHAQGETSYAERYVFRVTAIAPTRDAVDAIAGAIFAILDRATLRFAGGRQIGVIRLDAPGPRMRARGLDRAGREIWEKSDLYRVGIRRGG